MKRISNNKVHWFRVEWLLLLVVFLAVFGACEKEDAQPEIKDKLQTCVENTTEQNFVNYNYAAEQNSKIVANFFHSEEQKVFVDRMMAITRSNNCKERFVSWVSAGLGYPVWKYTLVGKKDNGKRIGFTGFTHLQGDSLTGVFIAEEVGNELTFLFLNKNDVLKELAKDSISTVFKERLATIEWVNEILFGENKTVVENEIESRCCFTVFINMGCYNPSIPLPYSEQEIESRCPEGQVQRIRVENRCNCGSLPILGGNGGDISGGGTSWGSGSFWGGGPGGWGDSGGGGSSGGSSGSDGWNGSDGSNGYDENGDPITLMPCIFNTTLTSVALGVHPLVKYCTFAGETVALGSDCSLSAAINSPIGFCASVSLEHQSTNTRAARAGAGNIDAYYSGTFLISGTAQLAVGTSYLSVTIGGTKWWRGSIAESDTYTVTPSMDCYYACF
jgi:hypothetical protein